MKKIKALPLAIGCLGGALGIGIGEVWRAHRVDIDRQAVANGVDCPPVDPLPGISGDDYACESTKVKLGATLEFQQGPYYQLIVDGLGFIAGFAVLGTTVELLEERRHSL